MVKRFYIIDMIDVDNEKYDKLKSELERVKDDSEKRRKVLNKIEKMLKNKKFIAYPIPESLGGSTWYLMNINNKTSERFIKVMKIDKMILTYLLHFEKYFGIKPKIKIKFIYCHSEKCIEKEMEI